jgi:hypothetical protein
MKKAHTAELYVLMSERKELYQRAKADYAICTE